MSTDTSPSIAQGTWGDHLDFDHPDISRENRQAALRARLMRRINGAAQPSAVINRLHAADARCGESIKSLKQLMGQAPRIRGVIRVALREAFAMDPDAVLFTEPGLPNAQPQVNSLTDRALGLLSEPFVPANINQFTTLSLKHDPALRLAFTPREALARVVGLGLLARLERTRDAYWQQLAYGSWLTRKERWVQLRQDLFAEKAFLAHQLYELSEPGLAMVRQLVDAPSLEARQRAGGPWATVQVAEVLWPGVDRAVVAIPGALHIFRRDEADAGPQVIYLPGLIREFHQFDSWSQLQRDLPPLLKGGLFSRLWQCLPLKRQHEAQAILVPRGPLLEQDALQHSAVAVLDGQWDNELACVLSIKHSWGLVQEPDRSGIVDTARFLSRIEKGTRKRLAGDVRLGVLLDSVLEWDRQRRYSHITLASLASGLALRTRERQVQRYEKGLVALLDIKDPGKDREDFQAFLALEAQWQVQADTVRQWTQEPEDRLLQPAFWLERPEGTRKRATLMLIAQRQAWLCEARLAQQLKLISSAHVERLEQVLNQPSAAQREGSDTCVLRVLLGARGETLEPLLGGFVVTTMPALGNPPRSSSVLLGIGGLHGGLATFPSLSALSEGLRASLSSRDGSALWRCIARDKRPALRALAGPGAWAVEYEVVHGDILHHLFNEQIRHYVRLETRLNEPTTLFADVTDPALGRLLLSGELREQLQVPVNETRAQSLANIRLWRLAAQQAKQQPAWLAGASVARRKSYKRLQSHYLSSALAFEGRLWQVLPDLETFARRLLTTQLTQDGLYPGMDIDQPLLDIPDDVSTHLCGWSSQCVVGDRQINVRVSPQRTTYSLLQLALHNLDAQAPWSEWRLNRARYLDPTWKARLTPSYLIKTLSALDVGGRYEPLIQQAFYPSASAQSDPANGLSPALSERMLRQRGRMQLFSAVEQGLSVKAQSLFNGAMAAREEADLRKNGQCIRLCFVRLRAYTLAHDRHIAGLLLIHDEVSGLCLVYWPAALDFPVLSQYPSLSQALVALNRDGASAANVKCLAQQVAPGWEAQALASYPGTGAVSELSSARSKTFSRFVIRGAYVLKVGEAIERFVSAFKIRHHLPAIAPEVIEGQIHEQIEASADHWLDLTRTAYSNPLALLHHARLLEIQHRSHARANSAKVLQTYRQQRLGEQRSATIRGLLSFVPVLGVGISLYEMLLAARRYHYSGDPREAVDVAFMTLFAFLDVLSLLTPGVKAGTSTATSAARASVRSTLSQLHRRQAAAGRSFSSLPASLNKSVKVLERFKRERLGAGTVELQGPDNKGIHVQNGESFWVRDSDRYPVYRRADESLWRLKSQQGEGQNELILNLQEPREWLLGADAPQPGPSSGILQPWASSVTSTDWSPPSPVALQAALPQSPVAPSTWQAWGKKTDQVFAEVLPSRRIYRVPQAPGASAYDAVKLGDNYYRLLPEGPNGPSPNLIFIMPNQPLGFSASVDINRWLGRDFIDQPIPATLGSDGLWTPHRALFSEPLDHSLRTVFPGMAASSRVFAAERLIELAAPERQATASHLLNIRATLDGWLTPGARGQTDDLLKMLRHEEIRPGRASLFIGYDDAAPGFTRLDFTVHAVPDRTLRLRGANRFSARAEATQAEVRHVLEQQGFVLRATPREPKLQSGLDFLCTHPKSSNVYYVLTRWTTEPSINLSSKYAPQLTDNWFERRIASRLMLPADALVLRVALGEKRLVRIIAGIQWPSHLNVPVVYFVKFRPVSV